MRWDNLRLRQHFADCSLFRDPSGGIWGYYTTGELKTESY